MDTIRALLRDRERRTAAVHALFGSPPGREAWEGAAFLAEALASVVGDPGEIVIDEE